LEKNRSAIKITIDWVKEISNILKDLYGLVREENQDFSMIRRYKIEQ